MSATGGQPNRHGAVTRPDLGKRTLLRMLGVTAFAALLALLSGLPFTHEGEASPGQPLRQAAAALGALLLLVPVAFSIAKRSGWSASPPTWFVAHVLCSAAGSVLIVYHAAAGDLLSPPGVVLLALIFLIAQGFLARALLSQRISTLFASRIGSFHHADPERRERIRAIIEHKRALLPRLDSDADEALFSPNLWHGLRHPWLTLRYARLAATEARLVGRREAGLTLAFWRRMHVAVACLFVAGLLLHVIIVTFFAGYAAGGGPIDWWHIAAWGG